MTRLRRGRDGSVPLLEGVRDAVLFVLFACLFVAAGTAVLYGTLSLLQSGAVADRRAGLAALAAFVLAVGGGTALLVVLDSRRETR